MRRLARNCGSTLVDLLVAATISSIVGLATVGFLLAQRGFQRKTELELETHQGLQAALDIVSRDIRLAALCTDKTGAFSAIAGTNSGTLDTITIRIGKARANLDCTRETTPTGPIPAVAAGAATIALTSVAGFAAGDRVYITGAGSGEFGKIASVNAGTSQIVLTSGVARNYVSATVTAFVEHTYSIGIPSGSTRQELLLAVDGGAPQEMATGITALDLRYELRTGCPAACQVVDIPATDAQWAAVRSVLLSVTATAARVSRPGDSVAHSETASLRVKPRNYTTQ